MKATIKFLIFIHRSDHGWSEEEVLQIMLTLQNRGVIKSMEFNSFTRIHHEDTEIRVRNSFGERQMDGFNGELLLCLVLGGQTNANHCFE